MSRTIFILALQSFAFWPVWRWYAARVAGSTDEAWSLLALVTLVFFLLRKGEARRGNETTTTTLRKEATCGTGWQSIFETPAGGTAPLALWWPTGCILLYALAYPFAPPLLRAGLAFVSLACTVSVLRRDGRRRLHAGTLGLLFLALPVVPSLQFYGGYPLRLFVAGVAAPLLRLGGFGVVREGTCLDWGGQLIWVDAPCSGVRMLWAGLFLACVLVCFYRLRGVRALSVLSVAFVAIIAGNIFRAVGLFYVEAGVIELPSWSHAGLGVAAFAFVAAGILASAQWLGRRETLCEAK